MHNVSYGWSAPWAPVIPARLFAWPPAPAVAAEAANDMQHLYAKVAPVFALGSVIGQKCGCGGYGARS